MPSLIFSGRKTSFGACVCFCGKGLEKEERRKPSILGPTRDPPTQVFLSCFQLNSDTLPRFLLIKPESLWGLPCGESRGREDDMFERQLCAQQGAKSLPGIKALGTHKKPTHAGSIVVPLYR